MAALEDLSDLSDFGDLSDAPDDDAPDAPPPPPLSNPPPGHKLFNTKYNTLDNLIDDLSEFAASATFFFFFFLSLRVCSPNNYLKDFGATRQAVAKALIYNDRKWTFELLPGYIEYTGHPPTDRDFNLLRSKVIFGPKYKAVIATYTDRPVIPNREIIKDLRKAFPDLIFIRTRKGYTPFQVTKKLLNDTGIYYKVR
ncbi:hypothetical protein B0T24DRAFT_606826 [Lasiosphaeria ovina]|uniref:Uncharacterized protein n=1 Tax=Lasiosphaeria ovina TaxID=92902 RepID=A0AAE0NLS6_9PEZI|nr:hypothetical protein B0T24DRAFT_606826 [Lasiosphaeria ovina]